MRDGIDGVFFSSASSAVEAARAIQRRVTEREEAAPRYTPSTFVSASALASWL